MKKRGKKYQQACILIEKKKLYSPEEGMHILEQTNFVKFDPTVEIHFHLNLDPKYPDQTIRSTFVLPNGTGKKVTICAFTDNPEQKEALKLEWVDVIGDEDLIEKILRWTQLVNFDVCIATPSMMKHLGKIAKILGPKGLMPNPKSGTVGENLVAIVKEIKAGKVELKTDKQGNVHSILGKLSFWKEKLLENFHACMQAIKEARPSWSKGKYILWVYICHTMGPSIPINITG